ncbi:hypothetical protein HanIR_Chr14g0708301 [Helianthus annuus]|nr:hypothetical protein HanIR_Chr14g0708301 [Helianthus annuus]
MPFHQIQQIHRLRRCWWRYCCPRRRPLDPHPFRLFYYPFCVHRSTIRGSQRSGSIVLWCVYSFHSDCI